MQHVVRMRVDHTLGLGCVVGLDEAVGVHENCAWGLRTLTGVDPHPWVVTESVGRLAEAGWWWSCLLPCGVGCVCFYVEVHALWLLLCMPVTARKCQRHHLWCNGFVWCCVLLCSATACGVSARVTDMLPVLQQPVKLAASLAISSHAQFL